LGSIFFLFILATAIGERRQREPIKTTWELAEIVVKTIPKRYQPRRIHPATRTFQALRITVNDELTLLRDALRQAPLLLRRGGRICVISFHSLEDRIVKESFKDMEKDCVCPPSLPQCVCGGHRRVLRTITRKPLTPRPEEVTMNPRSRSAKLRVAERV